MSRIFLFAGVAALAVAMPAAAEKGGKGGGHGNESGGKPQAAQNHGGGQGHGRGQGQGGGERAKPAKPDHSVSHAQRRGPDRGIERREARGNLTRQARVDQVRGGDRQDLRLRGRDRFDDRRRGDDVRLVRDGVRFVGFDRFCPPGLAKKNNGCLPPGQAKKLFGLGDRIEPAWFGGYRMPLGYRSLYYDSPSQYYRYDNQGYIYRVDSRSNMISGLIPLLGGGFAVGQPLPAGYDVYNVPVQYRDAYYDTDDAYYRYGDNAIYQVDPQSGMNESVVALLTGDMSVGEQLPIGYDAYNLPLDYRDRYADNEDYLYRYGDGNIYQVDAKTQIIQAIVEMLV